MLPGRESGEVSNMVATWFRTGPEPVRRSRSGGPGRVVRRGVNHQPWRLTECYGPVSSRSLIVHMVTGELHTTLKPDLL
ncbi:hypothetical protein GCM10010505_70670 [Kitasatospora aburaviensis]